jgi:hypothetical protein
LDGLQIPNGRSNQLADLRVARGLLMGFAKKERPQMKSAFETIANNELDMVAGGAGATGTPGASLNTSGGNSQLLSTVQGIQSSLKDLNSNQNQGLFSGPNGGLALGMMALAMRRNQQTTVVYGGRHGGYYWQSSW